MRLTIRQRLFLLTAVALVPALVAFGINEYQLRQARTADIHARALQQARLAASELERIFDGVSQVLRATATARETSVLPPPQCDAFLDIVAAQNPHVEAITIVDAATGRAVCDTRAGEDAALARAAAARNEMVIGEYHREPSAPALLPIAVPHHRSDGTSVVAIAQLRLSWLGDQLHARALSPGDAVTVADAKGVIVAREPLPERFVGTRIPPPYDALVASSNPGSLEVMSQDGTRRVIGYLPPAFTGGLYVSSGVSTTEAFAAINRATATSVAVMLAGACLALGLAWLVGRSVIRRPVDRLLAVSRAWQSGDLSARTGIGAGHSEFEIVAGALDTMMDALQQREAERQQASEQRALMSRELSHRAKNTLALVQAMASQTFAGGDPERVRRFSERLMALAASFDVLVAGNWTGASLRDAIEAAVRPHRTGEGVRFSMAGPDARLPPQVVVGLTLALHELATNAAKYGSLSAPSGRVAILWSIEGTAPARITLTWTESGGPPVSPPERQGFGSKLMRRILPSELRPVVEIDYAPTGVVATLAFDLVTDGATS